MGLASSLQLVGTLEQLEGFRRGTDVKLVRPSVLGLLERIDDSVGDGIWRNQGFGGPTGFAAANSRRVDLSIDNEMDHVDAFGMELPSERLAEDAEGGFGDRQRSKARTTTERGRSAG